jgi:hypothetical protein
MRIQKKAMQKEWGELWLLPFGHAVHEYEEQEKTR